MDSTPHPEIDRILNHYDITISRSRDSSYTAWIEPSFGAASGISNEVEANSLVEVLRKLEESLNKIKMQVGKYTLEGGGACPEQYNVMLNGEEVGYLRLRHGDFTADCPFGNTIYEAQPNGDGCFEADEREKYLEEAVAAIDNELNIRG